jgi:hypothetical protein
MAQTPTVALAGYKALMRDIVALSGPQGELTKAMVAAGRSAAEPVAEAARAALPHVSGRLAGDVRVSASRSGAGVRMGRASLRYAGPVDFGGYPGERPYIRDGRYLFPAAVREAPAAARAFEIAATAALASYHWTNTTTDPGGVHD